MKRLFLIIIVLALLSIACTKNQRVRNFGGEGQIVLPKGQKLVVATWKQDNLWILTREFNPNEPANTYKFSEQSSWGIWEGAYTIVEVK